jgi:hypothetical protein
MRYELPIKGIFTAGSLVTLVVAFYEKYGLSLRLAYNHRDPFLSDPDIRGQGTSSAFGERFSTLDLQAGYDARR